VSVQHVAQRRGRAPGLLSDYATEVALIDEAELGGQAREVLLAAREPLQRAAHTQSHPMTGDGLAGQRAKDSAEMMGRDREHAGDLW
jgi:hypothetical protein